MERSDGRVARCLRCGRIATKFWHGAQHCDGCFQAWWEAEQKRRMADDVCVYCGQDPCTAMADTQTEGESDE